jgi:DHA2 family multidrug resistance protein
VVAARLSQRIDARWTISSGLLLFAASLWMFSAMTPEWGFAALFWPQVLRGFAIMLCIVPSVNMALNGFAAAELRYASGLFNLMRNLGGAIGIAVVNTWLQDQTRLHVARFGESLGEAGRSASDVVAQLAGRIGRFTTDSSHALLMAQGELGRLATRAATTLAFDDVFQLMAWMFLAALLLVPFCRTPAHAPAAPLDAH